MAMAAEAAEAVKVAEAALVDKRGETGRSTDASARRQAASVQHHVRANNRSTNRQTNTCNLQDGDADAADVMRSLASKAPPKRGRDAGHAAPNAAAKRTKWCEYEAMNADARVIRERERERGLSDGERERERQYAAELVKARVERVGKRSSRSGV